MAKVLIIGANGFIGSHLVDTLSQEGHEVTAFDRFSSGSPLFQSTTAHVMAGDFMRRSDLERAVKGQDDVFHFLSTTDPASADKDPRLDVETNVSQSIELLDVCAASGIRHFYFASTGGAIYGEQGKPRYVETDRALPISPYGIGKLAIEHYLGYFRAQRGLQSTALRISNPYGGRQHPGKKQGFIPIALRLAMQGLPVARMGSGSMVRDYLYVKDLVSAIARMVGQTRKFDTYNLGSGVGHSVNEVLELIEKAVNRKIDIEQMPTPKTFVKTVVLDNSRFQNEFGAIQSTSLESGIRLTLKELA